MSDNPATPATAMPEPDPAPNATGQTSPTPTWWSRLHSPTDPNHSASATESGPGKNVPSVLPPQEDIAGAAAQRLVGPGEGGAGSGPDLIGSGGKQSGQAFPEQHSQRAEEEHRVPGVVERVGQSAHEEDAGNHSSDQSEKQQPIAHGVLHVRDCTSCPPLIWPERWTITPPVGSILTDVGVTFSLAPAVLTDRPVTARCTSCDWEATALQPDAVDAIRVHALRHIADPRPRISHFPDWLLPRLKGRR